MYAHSLFIIQRGDLLPSKKNALGLPPRQVISKPYQLVPWHALVDQQCLYSAGRMVPATVVVAPVVAGAKERLHLMSDVRRALKTTMICIH